MFVVMIHLIKYVYEFGQVRSDKRSLSEKVAGENPVFRVPFSRLSLVSLFLSFSLTSLFFLFFSLLEVNEVKTFWKKIETYSKK